jgi:UDP-3-O-[3-hydroxymyristoyl] N-acetylglucosamine deacetylase
MINATNATGTTMIDDTHTRTSQSVRQHTLAHGTSWNGPTRKGAGAIALHLHPAEADSGIWFLRTDLDVNRRVIAARWDTVVETRPVLTLANRDGVVLRGATTLLAALRVGGIDNALIEIEGPDVPSRPNDFESYLELLARAGVQQQALPRKALRVQQPIEVRDSAGIATLMPARDFRVQLIVPRAEADPTAALLDASLVSDLTEPAAQATAGGLRLEASAVPLHELMRLPFALRVRLIGVLGHLSLAGPPLIGHFTGYRSGTTLHHTLLRALMTRLTASYLTVDQHRMHRDEPTGIAGSVDNPSLPNKDYH